MLCRITLAPAAAAQTIWWVDLGFNVESTEHEYHEAGVSSSLSLVAHDSAISPCTTLDILTHITTLKQLLRAQW
jgi:hypothetical protein